MGLSFHILWLRTCTFSDLFCTNTSCWWPILYTRNFLMAHFLHTTSQVDLFSVSTNSSWPTLYTSNFYDLFRSLTCPLWDYFIEWYFLATWAGTSGVLFCIHTSSLWPLLYIRNFLMSYTLYIFPHVLNCRKKIRTSCDLVFNLVIFMAYFFIYFLVSLT